MPERLSANIPQDTPSEVLLKDFLRETTRRHRRSLMAVSVLTLTIVVFNLVPAEVPGVKISLDSAEELTAIMIPIGIVIIYFFLAFLSDAFIDFEKWKILFLSSFEDSPSTKANSVDLVSLLSFRPPATVPLAVSIRFYIQAVLPVVLAILALGVMILCPLSPSPGKQGMTSTQPQTQQNSAPAPRSKTPPAPPASDADGEMRSR